MVKTTFVFMCLLLPAVHAPSQHNTDPQLLELAWNEFYHLQWTDFQGNPETNSMGDAGAAVRIKAKPFLVKGEVKYDVVAIFNRGKSWARDTSPSLLAHEQLHFDIAELYARKIRQKIEELRSRGVNNIKTFNSSIQELLLESNKADEQYDLETLHGALARKQEAWSKKVKEELDRLEKHKKKRRVIGR